MPDCRNFAVSFLLHGTDRLESYVREEAVACKYGFQIRQCSYAPGRAFAGADAGQTLLRLVHGLAADYGSQHLRPQNLLRR